MSRPVKELIMKNCKVLRDFISPVYGNVKAGNVIKVESHMAEYFELIGLVEIQPETKVKSPAKAKRAPRKKTSAE